VPVTYLIVDDEAPGRINLRLAMEAHPGWILAAECASAAAARAALAARPADAQVQVIFLDIRMPGEDGLALARELARRPEPPLVIFVTAFSAHAVDAFDVHALDYLLKPVSDARLAQAVERAEALLRHGQRAAYGNALRSYAERSSDDAAWLDRISVRSVGRVEQVRVDDILWVEAAGNYVNLCLAARQVLHRLPLSRLETLLDPSVFVRVHRGTIVRRDQIGTLATVGDGSYRLTLRCAAQVAVSERYVGAIRALV